MNVKVVVIVICSVFVFLGPGLSGCGRSSETAELVTIDTLFQKGKFETALKEVKAFLVRHPQSHKGWNLAGWCHMQTDNTKEAEKCFDRSISIKSDWDNAYVGKGVLCRRKGDIAGARSNYKKAISLVPDNAEALSSLLVVELIEKNYAKAVEYGERAWKLRKNLPSIPANLSVAYHYAKNTEKRDYYFEEARKLKYPNLQKLKDIFQGKIVI